MPLFLRAACIVFAISSASWGALVPFYKSGFELFSMPLLSLLPVVITVQFARRVLGAWPWMKAAAFGAFFIQVIFFPAGSGFGSYLLCAKTIAVFEIASAAAILWALPESNAWFTGLVKIGSLSYDGTQLDAYVEPDGKAIKPISPLTDDA